MIQWLKDLFDRRLYLVRYDFTTRTGNRMVGTTTHLHPKSSAKRISGHMNEIYGPGTHWIEEAAND